MPRAAARAQSSAKYTTAEFVDVDYLENWQRATEGSHLRAQHFRVRLEFGHSKLLLGLDLWIP